MLQNQLYQQPAITITFLGTGTSSGVPMIGCNCAVCTSANLQDKRLRSSILVQSQTTTFVIDTTPDFRYQMLRIENKKLDAVLFTHPHKDHVAGLDDVRAYNYLQKKPMHIYANEFTMKHIQTEFYYAFGEKKYPGVPELHTHIIKNETFFIGDIQIIPILVWHHKMLVYGFRIGDFTYITDANKIDESELQKVVGTKILVLNALRKETHISHFTLQEAIDLSLFIQPEQTYFTHISHQLGLHNIINNELPPNIRLAYDGLICSF
ncbi:MAG: MBL fold metallo-hydrolase [Chitinophagaceae bacterium]